jgi:hypothetical protein
MAKPLESRRPSRHVPVLRKVCHGKIRLGRKTMDKRLFGIGLILLGFVFVVRAGGQFLAQEIAQRDRWEEYMLSAEIVRAEAIEQGVTKPWRLYLKKEGIERTAAWKNVDKKLEGGGRDSWRYEIAAYRLDKLIGLNTVPPAVEREFRGKAGVLSLWADSKYNLADLVEQRIEIPEPAQKHLEDMGYTYRLWCCLIANDDPTQENMRYTEDWRMIFIDFSRAFRADKEYAKRLVFGLNGIKRYQADGAPFIIRRVPRALLERIKGLDLAVLKQAVGPYLNDKEIQAIVVRVKLIENEIAEMVKRYGEATVLY